MRQTQIINELSKNNLTIKEMVSKFYKTTDKRLWPAAEKINTGKFIKFEG